MSFFQAETLRVDQEPDGSAVLWLDVPGRAVNVLNQQVFADLDAALNHITAEQAITLLIIRSAKAGGFLAGADLQQFTHIQTAADASALSEMGQTHFARVASLRVPVIAVIHGPCLGGGLELALACDIRIAADTASFAAPEIRLGWIGGSGQSALLAHNIGPSNAALMVLSGDPVDAATALQWRLVSEVVPGAELAGRARTLAETIAGRAPIAAQTAKLNLRAAYQMPLADAISYERHLQTICFATQDAAEGRAAFAARRAPNFQGR